MCIGNLTGVDANANSLVDVAGLGIVGSDFNTTITNRISDGASHGDNIVDVANLSLIGANWTAAQTAGITTPLVSEPTIQSLLTMSVLMVCRRRLA